MNIFQTYDYHSIFIYFNYDILQIRFFLLQNTVFLNPPIQCCFKKSHLRKFSPPPPKSALGGCYTDVCIYECFVLRWSHVLEF